MNIGNPYELSMLELAELIREIVGSSSEITFIPRPTDDPTVRQPDISLARAGLGWEPQVELREGLARTVKYFAEHPEVLAAAASCPLTGLSTGLPTSLPTRRCPWASWSPTTAPSGS